MTYSEAVEWLYAAVPNFQRDGGSKNYKIGLEGPQELWESLDFPSKDLPTIHIAGTNGKGSSAHMIAAGLLACGQRVGVFSSPHLFDFRERAKIGRDLVPKEFVASWVTRHSAHFEQGGYSFFELTLMLALSWFEQEQVDYIVLETGMGGRLDATNICDPEVCLITNIGLDHKEWLGDSRDLVAVEKAGIIKAGVPVVVVEQDPETAPVFKATAARVGAPLLWAKSTDAETDLRGDYQNENLRGAVAVLSLLLPEYEKLWRLGFTSVGELTGFFGRWSELSTSPKVVCDTGHNPEAFERIVGQAQRECGGQIHWVLGAAAEKDSSGMIALLPESSAFYWTSCSSPRCKSGEQLQEEAAALGKIGPAFEGVATALEAAKNAASENDLIFVGGSTFVVADLNV